MHVDHQDVVQFVVKAEVDEVELEAVEVEGVPDENQGL